MQLPRGTFHSIKKHVTVRALLDEASTIRFSGSIFVSFRDGTASMVLESGKTVLAAYGEMNGKKAYDQIGQMEEVHVDAELTILNESQLGLAKEFNKLCRTNTDTGSAIFFGKKESPQGIPSEQKTKIIPVTRKEIPSPGTADQQAPQRTFGEGEVEHLLNGDLDALDRMDLEKMSGKFRMNAQSIARELNLDHLGEG